MSGNGQRSGRRRGDRPSRTDKAAKRWAEGAPCLIQALAVLAFAAVVTRCAVR